MAEGFGDWLPQLSPRNGSGGNVSFFAVSFTGAGKNMTRVYAILFPPSRRLLDSFSPDKHLPLISSDFKNCFSASARRRVVIIA